MIRIYTKDNCPACVEAKLKMKAEWIEFEEVSAMDNLDYLISKWVVSLPYIETI